MASPVGNPSNLGLGEQQLKALVQGWIRDEIQASRAGGNGIHVDGLTGDLVADRGQFRSGNYVPGSTGWGMKPSGDQEFRGNTTIGGSTTIGGTLAVGAATTIGGTLGVTGPTTLGGATTVSGNTTVSGTLGVSGNTTLGAPTTVSGSLNVTGPATIGGTLGVTGTTTLGAPTTVSGSLAVTGPMTVSGTLSLPAGIIDNAALADPVKAVAAATATATAWNVTTGWVTVASTSIAVPAGFSLAAVTATASMHFQDSAPNGGFCRAVIAGNGGSQMGGLANLNIGVAALHSQNLAGLSGGSILLEIQVFASAASTATTGRIAQINGVATFKR